MGRDSRLSNELLTYDTPYYKVKSSDFDKKSDAELMEAVEKDYERVKEIWMTTEQASPMLSKRYRLLSRWQWKMGAAYSLVQHVELLFVLVFSNLVGFLLYPSLLPFPFDVSKIFMLFF